MKEFTYDELNCLEYELPEEVQKYKMAGDFEGARKSITRWLEKPVTDGMKTRLHLEQEILDLLEEEFPYTGEQVVTLFREQVSDFTGRDLNRLDEEGLAEWIFLDGEKHYIHNIVRNVLGKDDEIRKRAGIDGEISEEEKNLFAAIAEMKEKGSMTERFRLRGIRVHSKKCLP